MFKHLVRLAVCLTLLTASEAFASGGTCPSSVPSGITQCYFIDYASGNDNNSGTSESAPWQHLPGMAGCEYNSTGTACASLAASGTQTSLSNFSGHYPSSASGASSWAGYGFILKGGVTWPNAALGVDWLWSGSGTTSTSGCTGSGCIYIGVDPTWYAGSSWTRPIWNAGGAVLSAHGGYDTQNIMFRNWGNYVILDNIEMTGLYWNSSQTTGSYVSLGAGDPGLGMGMEIRNLYLHGWSHGTSASGTPDNACGIYGDTAASNNNIGSSIHDNVIDGTDTDMASCNGAIFGGAPYIYQNFIQYVASGMIIDGPMVIDSNTILHVQTSFASGTHTNGIEVNWAGNNVTISNNNIAHLQPGTLGIWCAPNGGYGCYIFNNTLWDTDTGNVLDLAASLSGSTGWDYVWNNTIECGPDSNPSAVCIGPSSSIAGAVVQNNQFITNAGSYWTSTSGLTPTLTNNLLQTKAQATSAGYTSSETDVFSPTSSSSPTVGAGTSASSLCTASGIASVASVAASNCTSATTFGVTESSAYSSVYPALTAVSRPTTPDIGAYQYQSQGSVQSQPPAVPTGLSATAQ